MTRTSFWLRSAIRDLYIRRGIVFVMWLRRTVLSTQRQTAIKRRSKGALQLLVSWDLQNLWLMLSVRHLSCGASIFARECWTYLKREERGCGRVASPPASVCVEVNSAPHTGTIRFGFVVTAPRLPRRISLYKAAGIGSGIGTSCMSSKMKCLPSIHRFKRRLKSMLLNCLCKPAR